jgi:hypothetical protein
MRVKESKKNSEELYEFIGGRCRLIIDCNLIKG